jgi:tRNA dimethylallyltransferase
MQSKNVFIVGPTAVGKTNIAFECAHRFSGELISADSVQVYRGLDIISGKDIPKASKFISLPQLSNGVFNSGYYIHNNINIFLLDVVEPSYSFSVSNFRDLATRTIDFIQEEKKLPIVVGGTGLYIKSLIDGFDMNPIEPDIVLRSLLENLNVFDLQNKLEKLNLQKLLNMNDSDRNNKRRLIRAIEISMIKNPEPSVKNEKNYENLVIGLTCERDMLKQRIDIRVENRLENGAMEEAKVIFENYENLSAQVKDANGYKQLFSYFKKEISIDEAIYRWKVSEYHHAKNQMTWFRKYGDTVWFDITKKGYEKEIENKVKKFLE